ncbi:hypothetical protein GALMADRAFT_428690 [Galerina marginata CBS 339.88]|uniref:Uncharacterized protein n=1 Tax=Galerina marginata (strain CBS 339.88) TaxID=685588 RepID=A0A067TB34_GALM3|nr:hypothetical protein GALMADRAFT_428690 [Galerina marginata CBS 339.88]
MKNKLSHIFHSFSSSASATHLHHPSRSSAEQVQTVDPMSLTSPANLPQSMISSFPAELLLEIFDRVCEPPQDFEALQVARDRHSGPLSLGGVCKQWRDIAWSSPTLWTYIYLVPLSDKCADQAQLLDAYLGRSKGLPLTVVFRPVRPGNNQVMPLFDLIARECYRWEAIDILIPYYLLFTRIQQGYYYLPRLRSVRTVSTMTGFSRPEGFSLSFLKYATELQKLALTGVVLPKLKDPQHYQHITHFTVSKLSCDRVLDALDMMPNLRSCFVEDMTRSSSATVPRVHLRRLESFSIRNSSNAESRLFQNILSIPMLREIECIAGPGGHLPLVPMKSLLDQDPACRLEILELRASQLLKTDTSFLDGLLRRTTTVSKFVLHCKEDETLSSTIGMLLNPLWPPVPPFHNRPFVETFLDGNDPVLLPNLQNLELYFSETDSLLPVINVIKHRWIFGSATSLDFTSSPSQGSDKQFAKIISVRLPGWCSSEVMKELRDEMREGLVVEFSQSLSSF